jgi:hypothetical protein
MKDFTQQQYIEALTGDNRAAEKIRHVLCTLFYDKDNEGSDEVVEDLTFEELIGALLEAEERLSQKD